MSGTVSMPFNLKIILNQGMAALQSGRWAEAEGHFRNLISRTPKAPEPVFYLGLALLSGGKPDEAASVATQLIRKHGEHPAALNLLGSAQAASGRTANAEKSLRRALALAPDLGDAAENLARLLIETGRPGEAIEILRSLLGREPNRVASHHLLGRAMGDSGGYDDAVTAYHAGLRLAPDFHPALNDLGLLHLRTGKAEEALACFEQLLRLAPNDLVAANNRGAALRTLERYEEAEAQYRSALERFPDSPQVNLNLGKLLAHKRRVVEAAPLLELSNCLEGRWWDALLMPPQYESEAERLEWRTRLEAKLRAVADETMALPAAQLPSLGEITNLDMYYLAYHGENDRDINATLRAAQTRVAQALHGFSEQVPHQAARPRIRVGFISQSFFGHVIYRMTEQWITSLNPNEFEVFAFHTGRYHDEFTNIIAGKVEHFLATRRHGSTANAARLISEAELDVIIYLETGMHFMTDQLAMLRLAPVQCSAFTHPITTGMPTIDYFISGELMEPSGADEHYTEKLIRLPGLGFSMARPEVEGAPLSPAEPDRPGPRLFCAQSLFKMLPHRDHLFPRIVKAVGDCRIDFISHTGHLTEIFGKRMERVFTDHGLEPGRHFRILPGVSPLEFQGLIKAADVFLDTPDWSGGHTTMEALACCTPIAAMQGRFLRGNVSAGILRAAGLDELVAADEEAYVALAARLALDADYRRQVSETMHSNGPAVFDSPAPARGLAEFLRSVVRTA